MSTHNIGFYEDLTKIIFELSSNIIKYAPYFFCCRRILRCLLLLFYKFLIYRSRRCLPHTKVFSCRVGRIQHLLNFRRFNTKQIVEHVGTTVHKLFLQAVERWFSFLIRGLVVFEWFCRTFLKIRYMYYHFEYCVYTI